jgi:ABC-type Na+ efflux pump permease subunit
MKRRTLIILWVYLAGALIFETLLLWDVYNNGGFQRDHTPGYLILVASIYVAMGLLWPIVLALAVLQYFAFLPHPITF